MKERSGFVLFISGWLLMLQDMLNLEEIIELFNYVFAHYWPIILILIGAYMLFPKKKKRTR